MDRGEFHKSRLHTYLMEETDMRTKLIFLLAAALFLVPFTAIAQAPVADSSIQPFLGKWVGQEDECKSAADCQSSNIQVNITNNNGQAAVEFTISPATEGKGRHSSSFTSQGSNTRTFPAKFETRSGGTILSYLTKSGTRVELMLQGGKLVGHNTSGRFNLRYSLTKAGS